MKVKVIHTTPDHKTAEVIYENVDDNFQATMKFYREIADVEQNKTGFRPIVLATEVIEY